MFSAWQPTLNEYRAEVRPNLTMKWLNMWLHWEALMFLKMGALCLETESSNSWECRSKSNRCSNLSSCIKSSFRRRSHAWKMSHRASTILSAENTTKYSIRKWEGISHYLKMKDHQSVQKIRIFTLYFQSSNRSRPTKRTIMLKVRQWNRKEKIMEEISLPNSIKCCK